MSSVDVAALLQRQGEVAGPIERAITNLKKVGEANFTKRRIQGRLEALRQNWKTYRDNHARIVNLRESTTEKTIRTFLSEHDYFKNTHIDRIEECFLEAQEFMETRLDVILADEPITGEAMAERSLDPPSGATHHNHRLPKIELPRFDGNPRDWISFRDLFFALVGSNTGITNVEKLHYLKSSLSGIAAQRVESIGLSHDNFVATWNYLSSIYDDKRLLVNAAMRDFIETKPVQKTSGSDLDRFNGEIARAITALESLGQYTHHCDAFVIYIVVSKLDANTVREWEESIGSTQLLPTWVKLMKFLEVRARSLQAFESVKPRQPQHSSKPSRPRQAATAQAVASPLPGAMTTQTAATPPQAQGCSMCGAKHYIASCQTFRNRTPEQRKALVTEKQLCFNCLGHHRVSMCRSGKRCQHCSGQHHTLIHAESSTNPQVNSSSAERMSNTHSTFQENTAHSSPGTSATANHVVSQPLVRKNVLITTASVRVQSPQGVELQARALLDSGSELSFISEALAQLLKLSRQRVNVPLVGIGAQQSGASRGVVTCTVKPRFNSIFAWQVTAQILPKLTADLPSLRIQGPGWAHLKGLQLADPDYAAQGKIDLILGSDVYGQLLEGVRSGPADAPIAHPTKLGWVLCGPTASSNVAVIGPPVQGLQCSVDYDLYDHNLHNDLQRFWIQEEVPSDVPSALSPEEEECERHFLATHSRDASGRYKVRLPFRSSPDLLGDSRACAARMLSRMQTRLHSDSTLKILYSTFLQEYETLGHMQPVSATSPESQRGYYLPHHGVLKDSTTTKLRVVFNGSSRTSSGHSLNDVLHTGAKLQTDLHDVILRWRQYQFAFSADIEKMFRQISVHEDDWRFQRILWSPDSAQPIKDYELTTVTYGLGPAPFLAIRVLRQLAEDERHRFPQAADIICRSTYVDDAFGGADTLQEAQRASQQLDELCLAGGFKLQKWTSNYAVVLTNFKAERLATANSLALGDELSLKTLGIVWKPNADSFEFSGTRSKQEAPFTKRKVLSRVSQLFDPLGWLSPVMIRAKILMQDLWREKVAWDEALTDPILSRWLNLLEQLETIPQFSIPRWLGTSSSVLAVEIHGFSDASEQAMAAVVYLRVLRDLDDAHISLISSRTKVAPLKRLTIPRLELTAATLLIRQVSHIRLTLNLENAPIHLWTDSTVTLAWIQGHHSRWKDYVRNRVSAIQEALPSAHWHHVPGHDNPADCASRGVTPQQLKEHRLWWSGPSWLAQHSTSWPTGAPTLDPDINLEERKSIVATASTTIVPHWDLLERYSSLNRLIRITATCRRLFTRRSPLLHPLTPDELNAETLFWVKTVQQAYYATEIKLLAEGKTLPASNPLNRLIPFVEKESGLLRLGGRLRNTLLDPDTKHPLIVPKDSRLSTLLIDDAHAKTLHGGTQSTLAHLRRNYWILGGRAPIRSYILRCVRCTRFRGVAARQLMGQLPRASSTRSRPFQHAGIDYAGPLTIKAWRGRTTKTYKGYIVLFVCFSTSALHLEAVTDYSTAGFIAAFKRFTGRRGVCATLTSDCGTNLVGADNELRKLFSQSTKELGTLATLLANDGTEWKFNPPSAPHFGGKWEAGVKSVKFHLRRVIGDHVLTYEELSTLLVQIEAVLNSRPLCPLSDDPADVNALTPGHFLIGSAITSVPEPSLFELPVSRLSRWQLVRQLLEHFWTRWSSEYLQRFQAISKWHRPTNSLKPGALVLIIDERYPASKWPLARVVETHPGADGLIRVATVKTQTSTFKRPIVKLCPLPVQSPDPTTAEL